MRIYSATLFPAVSFPDRYHIICFLQPNQRAESESEFDDDAIDEDGLVSGMELNPHCIIIKRKGFK